MDRNYLPCDGQRSDCRITLKRQAIGSLFDWHGYCAGCRFAWHFGGSRSLPSIIGPPREATEEELDRLALDQGTDQAAAP